MEFDFEVARVYLQSDEAVEFLLLETDFRLEAKRFVIEERGERGHRTAVNGLGSRGVDFAGHRQRYDVLRVYLRTDRADALRPLIALRVRKRSILTCSNTLVLKLFVP